MMDSDWGNAGLPLECFKETKSDGKVMLAVLDEDGLRYDYKGPTHSNSTTTIFGKWTGPAPFANDLPIRVKTTNGFRTSALDSFSMLYTIQCYETGHHTADTDANYIGRISAALARGVISPWRNVDEFQAAMRIIQAFETKGHIFDVVSQTNQLTYAARNASEDLSARWIEEDASSTFPLFMLSQEELELWRHFLSLNGMNVKIQTMEDMIMVLKQSGLDRSYFTTWFEKRFFEQKQAEFAFEHLRSVLLREIGNSPYHLPSWDQRTTNTSYRAVSHAATVDRIAKEITSEIIESLL